MANEYAGTVLTPEIIESKVMETVERSSVWRKLIGAENIYNFTGKGKVNNIAQTVTVSFSTTPTSEGASPSNTPFTPTDRQLTLATFRLKFFVPWEQRQYAQGDPETLIANAVAEASILLEEYSSVGFASLYADCSNLTSSPDHLIGADATAMTAALLELAKLKLQQQILRPPYYAVIDPIQQNELMADGEAVQWLRRSDLANSPHAKILGESADMYLGEVSGIQVYKGDAMIESSGLHAIVFKQGAFALGYKTIDAEDAGSGAEVSVGTQWDGTAFGWAVNARKIFDVGGAVVSATNNNRLVDVIS